MNKLEYIPGDIVKIEYGEATGKIGFVTNTFLRRKGCYSLVVFIGKGFEGSSKDDWIQTYNDEVSPIPLTTEILEKNGYSREDGAFGVSPDFKKIINDPARKKGYITCLSVYPFFDNDGFSFFYNNQKLAIIHYVHELQHILYGLKINSEMEV